MSAYNQYDLQRWVPEAPKPSQRSDFARDCARILHAAAWRRLAARTQVMLAGSADFPRTRMTHSLECAQIGREMAAALGADPDLVQAACLAHDLGHPPFGHNGEAALNAAAAAIGGFEGNAQTLRILTRLEPKAFGTPTGGPRSVGLNLTRATLDATCKYPWERHPGQAKYGVYAADWEAFAWMRAGAPARRRCFEAQLMDWADDVAYSVHDVEDGIHAGLVDPRVLRDPSTTEHVCAVAQRMYAPGAAVADLQAAYDRLRPNWPFAFDGSLRDQANLKNLTSSLIGRFTAAAEVATREANGARLTRFAGILAVPPSARLEVSVLKAIAYEFVMSREDARKRQERQREMIAEVLAHLVAGAPATLAPEFHAPWSAAMDDGEALRVVIDQVATLTDTSLVARTKQIRRRS